MAGDPYNVLDIIAAWPMRPAHFAQSDLQTIRALAAAARDDDRDAWDAAYARVPKPKQRSTPEERTAQKQALRHTKGTGHMPQADPGAPETEKAALPGTATAAPAGEGAEFAPTDDAA